MMKRLAKIYGSVILILTIVLTTIGSNAYAGKPNGGGTTPSGSSSDLAYNWIKAQKGRSGLYASFANGNDAYTYDQAVAVIAFLLKNDVTNAKALLNKLQSLQGTDGSFCNAYYASTGRLKESAKHVGVNLWVALAVMNYEQLTGDVTTYHSMGDKIVQWTLQFQQNDGGVNGGLDFDGSLLTYASTEHNLDAYSTYSYFGYTNAAASVKSFLDNVAWDSTTEHFRVGRPNGDTNDVLDVNPWGVLALGVSGTHNYGNSLNYSLNVHRNTQSLNGKTYDLFDFNQDKNDIWFEGSNFMVIALNKKGDVTNANYFLNEIIKNQDVDGGVQYSLLGTNNWYWTMSSDKAISSTGWLIMAIDNYNPF